MKAVAESNLRSSLDGVTVRNLLDTILLAPTFSRKCKPVFY